MNFVRSTCRTKLLDRKLLRHRPLILGRIVVCSAASITSQLDEITHRVPAAKGMGSLLEQINPSMRHNHMKFLIES